VLGDEEVLRRLVENAGFANVRMEDVPVHNDYPRVDEYVRRSSEMGGMFSRAWAEAPEEEQERMKDEFRRRLHRSPSTAVTSYRASRSASSRTEPHGRRVHL